MITNMLQRVGGASGELVQREIDGAETMRHERAGWAALAASDLGLSRTTGRPDWTMYDEDDEDDDEDDEFADDEDAEGDDEDFIEDDEDFIDDEEDFEEEGDLDDESEDDDEDL